MTDPNEWEFSIFAFQCFGLVALLWVLHYLGTRWLAAYRRRDASKQYNRGYIFAMQALRAGQYTAVQLLNMADGPEVTQFDRGIRDGVRSYQGYGELNLALNEALNAARNNK